MRSSNLLLLLVCCPGAALATGQEKPQAAVIDQVTRCRAVMDAQTRLKCYDASVAALAEAVETRSVVVLSKEEVKRTRRSLFGFSLPRLSFFGGDDDDTDDMKREDTISQFDSTIVSVNSTGYGLWSMTLAEGGTWRTMEPSRSFSPSAKAKIVIKRGPLGNFLASVDGQRAVRVQRIG